MDAAVPPRTVSTGTIPEVARVQALLEQAHERFASTSDGRVADYIPALASADPQLFGLSVTDCDGHRVSVGDADHAFSIQSVSKPFVLALAMRELGTQTLRRRIGVNATGRPFDSLVAFDEQDAAGNPMVNAGAIITTSLVPGASIAERRQAILNGLAEFAGRPLAIDSEVLASELATNASNVEVARRAHRRGLLDGDPEEAVALYTEQCAVLVTADDLSTMAATLADGGVNPVTGRAVVSAEVARATLAVMATAGLYETSGEWLFDVGLPGKSGVSGGVITVAPGKGGLATFSPALDDAGNSVRGVLATVHLSRSLGLDLLASMPPNRSTT